MNEILSLTGKKVFFLYPPSVIRDEVASLLSEQEFEIYLLRDHGTANKLLASHPDSIVFVNIDDGQSEAAWETWIRNLKDNPATREVGIGILSYNSDEGLQKKYLMDIGITCGFVKLKLGVEQSAKILIDTLKANEAKGRRKYVRVNCVNDHLSSVNLMSGGKQAVGNINDISAVGFSATFETDPGLSKNSLLADIQLKLRGVLLRIEAIVYGERTNGHSVYVFLFTPKMDGSSRSKIRKYIQASLQADMESEIK